MMSFPVYGFYFFFILSHMEDIYSICLLNFYICTTCINCLKLWWWNSCLWVVICFPTFSFSLPQEILLKQPCFSFFQFKNCSPGDRPFLFTTLVEKFSSNCILLWWFVPLKNMERNKPIYCYSVDMTESVVYYITFWSLRRTQRRHCSLLSVGVGISTGPSRAMLASQTVSLGTLDMQWEKKI